MMVRTCRGFAWTAAVAAGMVGWMISASNLRAQEAQEFGLGDIALPEDDYAENQLTSDTLESLAENQWDLTALPEFDARTRGWVTDAKNQGVCGSCWAFAAVGTIESRILKEGGPQFDFSEQQLVSCNSLMYGCCGGSGSSLKFFQNDRPITETSVPYAEAGTNCPTQRTIPCGSISGVDKPYLLSGFYTVQPNPAAFKMSLLTHGPSYFRYDVYSDFFTHWNTAPADAVYQNSGGSREGGHAVLLIGWSDSKQAFLLKNSWGKDGGPNDDGTFWMSYSGHANDLHLQMFNVSDLVHPAVDSRIALVSATAVDAAVQTLDADQGGAGFEESTGYLQSLPIAAEEQAQPADGPDSAPGFGWYNNLRVNGNTTLTDTVRHHQDQRVCEGRPLALRLRFRRGDFSRRQWRERRLRVAFPQRAPVRNRRLPGEPVLERHIHQQNPADGHHRAHQHPTGRRHRQRHKRQLQRQRRKL